MNYQLKTHFFVQKSPTDSISRDDIYRGTTLVVDFFRLPLFIVNDQLTVFPFIKTILSLLRKRCSRTVIRSCLCTGLHQPPALCYRETTTTAFPFNACIFNFQVGPLKYKKSLLNKSVGTIFIAVPPQLQTKFLSTSLHC